MELLEIYADAAGETHFRRSDIAFEEMRYAPPSQPIHVSTETPSTTSLFLTAPPGWDEQFHPTPRRQLAVLLKGEATIRASDGEIVTIKAGDVILLNDQASKGHLTLVKEPDDAHFLLVGLADED